MIQCSISIVKGAYKILEQAIDQIQKWAEETGKFEAIAWASKYRFIYGSSNHLYG